MKSEWQKENERRLQEALEKVELHSSPERAAECKGIANTIEKLNEFDRINMLDISEMQDLRRANFERERILKLNDAYPTLIPRPAAEKPAPAKSDETALSEAHGRLADRMEEQGRTVFARAIRQNQKDITELIEKVENRPLDKFSKEQLRVMRSMRLRDLQQYREPVHGTAGNELADKVIAAAKNEPEENTRKLEGMHDRLGVSTGSTPEPLPAPVAMDPDLRLPFSKPRRRLSKPWAFAIAAFIAGAAVGVLGSGQAAARQATAPVPHRMEAAAPVTSPTPKETAMPTNCKDADYFAERLIESHYKYTNHVGDMMVAASEGKTKEAAVAANRLQKEQELFGTLADSYRAAVAKCTP